MISSVTRPAMTAPSMACCCFRGRAHSTTTPKCSRAAGLTEPTATMADYTTYAEALTQRDGSFCAPTVSGWSMRLAGGAGHCREVLDNMFSTAKAWSSRMPTQWKADLLMSRAALRQAVSGERPHAQDGDDRNAADAEAFERERPAMFIRESWVIGDIAAKARICPMHDSCRAATILRPVSLWISGRARKRQAPWPRAGAHEPDNLLWLLDNVAGAKPVIGWTNSAILEASRHWQLSFRLSGNL